MSILCCQRGVVLLILVDTDLNVVESWNEAGWQEHNKCVENERLMESSYIELVEAM